MDELKNLDDLYTLEEESDVIDFNDYDSDEELPHNMVWDGIVAEIKNKNMEIQLYHEEQEAQKPDIPQNSALKYLEEEIFPTLLPILKNTLYAAQIMECITHQKSIFNGIDFIAQLLWNSNPKHELRLKDNQNIYLMDWVIEWLKKHPRQIFPKSWLWSKETAAIIIQSYMRGHWVRRTDEVQEMRQFWKALKLEKEENEAKKE